MSAGTQGFTDTRLDTDHIGMVISKILEARKLAEDERKYAEQLAEKYQTSLEEAGISRGYFFKKALKFKFGGEYKGKKLAQLEAFKKRASLLKTAVKGKSGKNKLDLFERTQLLFDIGKVKPKTPAFRDQFVKLYEGFVDDPMTRPKSSLVKPGSARRFKKAVFGGTEEKKKIQKTDILNAIISISEALKSTAESIQNKNTEISQNISRASTVQASMLEQLKVNNTSLESKLDKIINALNNQTQVQKKTIQKAETKKRESDLEKQSDTASIKTFDDLTTPENEIAQAPVEPQSSMIPATSAQAIEMQQMQAYGGLPQLERGGIVSGPDSGYLAKLHGDEMIVPLDNNYTQGQPSAVDGKVRPKPSTNIVEKKQLQKYETGTKDNNLTSPVTSKVGFNPIKPSVSIGDKSTKVSNIAQTMVDTMSLIPMAAGGAALSATTNYMQEVGAGSPGLNQEIEKIARPIASVFGLPQTIVQKTKNKNQKLVKDDDKKKKKKEKKEEKKSLFDRLKEGFGKFLEKLKNTITGDNKQTTTPGAVDYSNLKSGDISSMAGKSAVLYDEFRNLGYTDEGAKRVIAEIGREGGMQNKNLFGTHTDPAAGIANTGMISWNDTRRDKLIAAAKKAGVWDEAKGQFKETAEALRFQARFLANEVPTYKKELDKGLRTEGYDPAKISQMLRDDYIVYRTTGGYSGGPNAQFGSNKTKEWYDRLTPGLEKTYKPNKPNEPNKDQKKSLGQAITNNYGMATHEKFFFKHNDKSYHAYKTAVGFDFYEGTRKITDPSEEKAVIETFIRARQNVIAPPKTPDKISSANTGLNNITGPRSGNDSLLASLSQETQQQSSKSQIALLNLPTQSSTPSSAGSVPQVSGSSGTEAGVNPTKEIYSNPFSIALG